MISINDYSKTIFSQGIVCWNKNNGTRCVVIDGRRGTEDDRCSLVMEFTGGEDGLILHTPPNRALVPTGRIYDLKYLRRVLIENVADTQRREGTT